MRRFFCILCLFALLVGGFWIFLTIGKHPEMRTIWQGSSTPLPMSYDAQQEATQKSEANDIDHYNRAMRDQDALVCQAITDTARQAECLDMVGAALAQKSDTLENCQTLVDTGTRDRCHDNILSARAEKQREASACLDIFDENLRASCSKTIEQIRYQEASQSGLLTPDFCTTLSSDLRTSCEKSVNKTKDLGVYREATRTRSLDACTPIADADMKNTCRDIAYLSQALEKKDSTLCTQILDTKRKTLCETQLSRQSEILRLQAITESGDITACATLTDASLQIQCRDRILITQVQRDKNPEICSSLSTSKLQEACQKIANSK